MVGWSRVAGSCTKGGTVWGGLSYRAGRGSLYSPLPSSAKRQTDNKYIKDIFVRKSISQLPFIMYEAKLASYINAGSTQNIPLNCPLC